jgi:hypothetical protein
MHSPGLSHGAKRRHRIDPYILHPAILAARPAAAAAPGFQADSNTVIKHLKYHNLSA